MSFIYKGLSAQLEKHIVTEEEMNHQLERLRSQTPRIAAVQDRPTQLGDEVVLDYAGFCDGEQFAGGTAENQTLVLGSGTFIPGFEEQLLDKVPGEKVTVTVTFPEVYHAENLAGKKAEFHCTIHEIRIRSAYELDDVFAKEVGGCDTLAEMQEKLLQSMQSYADDQAEMELQDNLLRQASATLELEISQEQIEKAMDSQLQTLEAQLTRQGLSLQMYCQFTNTTVEELRADLRPDAIQSIRSHETIETIAKLENLQADQEDIAKAISLICRQNQITEEQLQGYYDAEFEAAVVHSVLAGKVMRLIRDAATITVV